VQSHSVLAKESLGGILTAELEYVIIRYTLSVIGSETRVTTCGVQSKISIHDSLDLRVDGFRLHSFFCDEKPGWFASVRIGVACNPVLTMAAVPALSSIIPENEDGAMTNSWVNQCIFAN
jgi:hypothetical protein